MQHWNMFHVIEFQSDAHIFFYHRFHRLLVTNQAIRQQPQKAEGTEEQSNTEIFWIA